MNLVQGIAVMVSGVLFFAVLELVRRRKLTEEHSFIWLAGAGVLLALSIWREILHVVADWLGVFYPPMVLLLVVVFFVFVALLYFSVVISTQRRQIEQLVEDVALLTAEKAHLQKPDEPENTESDDGIDTEP